MSYTIPVVLSTDHNFVMPTSVAIQSLLESASTSNYHIHILQSESVTDSDRQILQTIAGKFNAAISFVNPGHCWDNAHQVRGITQATYYRLLIPWLLPDCGKVVYLDGDIIVKQDLGQLIEACEGDGNLVWGVRTPGFVTDPDFKMHIRSLGIKETEYVNSGVLVFNSPLMRKERTNEKFLALRDDKFLYQDQDLLNIVCSGRKGFLPLKYNASPERINLDPTEFINAGTTTAADFKEAIANPAIIHFAGKKPWKTLTNRWWDWVSVYERTPLFDLSLPTAITQSALHPTYSTNRLMRMLAKRILKGGVS